MGDLSPRPRIGITVGTADGWSVTGESYRSYASAVESAGGESIRLGRECGDVVSRCAGLLVTGGWDVHPRHYERLSGDEALSFDELARKYRVQWEEERDETELPQIRQALNAGMPILAICRGIQSLNVVLCRRLLPDLEMCVPGALPHEAREDGTSERHWIRIRPGSLIERVYGSAEIEVNSRHHQGMTLREAPGSLAVTAVSRDGVVEAVEGVTSQLIVGVQWHPERSRDGFIYEPSKALFEVFVRACGGEQCI